jgi:hypothetical protein
LIPIVCFTNPTEAIPFVLGAVTELFQTRTRALVWRFRPYSLGALTIQASLALALDLCFIRTILSHATPVHGVEVLAEKERLARLALKHINPVGKGIERNNKASSPHFRIARFVSIPCWSIPVSFMSETNVSKSDELIEDEYEGVTGEFNFKYWNSICFASSGFFAT